MGGKYVPARARADSADYIIATQYIGTTSSKEINTFLPISTHMLYQKDFIPSGAVDKILTNCN